jgi:signal transduction histidine kinase
MNLSQSRVANDLTPSPGPDHAPAQVIVPFRQRPDFSFDRVDPGLEKLAGVPTRAWGRRPADFWELVYEDDRAWLREHLALHGQSPDWLTTPYRLRHWLTGHVCHVLECRRLLAKIQGQPDGFEGFWLDQTRARRAERRLATAARKESLAQLTTGYIHDLNNVLAGIASMTELCLMDMEPGHPLQQKLAMVKGNTRRASQLLDDFSRLLYPRSPQHGYYDLNELGERSLHLLRPAVARRISLEGRWAGMPLPVFADGNALQQALFHLVFNAAAAIAGPGQIVLQTSRQDKFRPPLTFVGLVPTGPSACLAVTDTGRGIVPDRGSRVFDWCFSTRVGNAGIGMGLALLRQFVLSHGGAVTVESNPSRGATFQIWLPLAEFRDEETWVVNAGEVPWRILLVGSDGPVAGKLANGLRKVGWAVVWAKQDPELTLAAGDESFAAAVLLAGKEPNVARFFIETVRQQKVHLKIILVTETKRASSLQAVLEQVDLVLDKALGVEGLREKIQTWLAECVEPAPKSPEVGAPGASEL